MRCEEASDVKSKIGLEGLVVTCIIGELDFEREQEQELLIDISLELNLNCFAEKDDLEFTVDHRDLVNEITHFAQNGKFHLLETLGFRLVRHLVDTFPLDSAKIKIIKAPENIPCETYVELEYRCPGR